MERDLVSERFGPEPHSEEGESRNSISEFRVWGQGGEASNPDSADKHTGKAVFCFWQPKVCWGEELDLRNSCLSLCSFWSLLFPI